VPSSYAVTRHGDGTEVVQQGIVREVVPLTRMVHVERFAKADKSNRELGLDDTRSPGYSARNHCFAREVRHAP